MLAAQCNTRCPTPRAFSSNCRHAPAAVRSRQITPRPARLNKQRVASGIELDWSDPDTLTGAFAAVLGIAVGIGAPLFYISRDNADDKRLDDLRELNRQNYKETGKYLTEVSDCKVLVALKLLGNMWWNLLATCRRRLKPFANLDGQTEESSRTMTDWPHWLPILSLSSYSPIQQSSFTAINIRIWQACPKALWQKLCWSEMHVSWVSNCPSSYSVSCTPCSSRRFCMPCLVCSGKKCWVF